MRQRFLLPITVPELWIQFKFKKYSHSKILKLIEKPEMPQFFVYLGQIINKF